MVAQKVRDGGADARVARGADDECDFGGHCCVHWFALGSWILRFGVRMVDARGMGDVGQDGAVA